MSKPVDDAHDKMHKVVVHLQDQFGSVRTVLYWSDLLLLLLV